MSVAKATVSQPNCPICLQAGARKFTLGDYEIFACVPCQHNYLVGSLAPNHVAAEYADHYFNGGGAGYDDYLSSRELVEDHGRRYCEIIARHQDSTGTKSSPPGQCFAIGAAAGFDLVGFHEAGWTVGGVEPNASMCDFAKETLGFDLMNASLEHLQNAPKADLVIALQVMAHFVAPQVAATQIANLTKPGGWLLVETWNHRSRTARLFGKHWHEYSPPTVVQWFSPKSLERLMSQHGFEKVAAGRPKKFIRSEHAVSLLRYKIDSIPIVRWGSPLLRLIPEKLNIPYPSEDLFWMLFQRSENA